MASHDVKKAVAMLVGAYRTEAITDETVALYVQLLRDIEPGLLATTTRRLIERSRFFPSVAEIRQTAAELAGVLPMPVEAVTAIVREADVSRPVLRRDGTVAYTEREWAWPEELPGATLRLIRQALSTVGDPVAVDGRRAFAWDADFKAAYKRVADEATHDALADLSRAVLPQSSRPQLVS